MIKRCLPSSSQPPPYSGEQAPPAYTGPQAATAPPLGEKPQQAGGDKEVVSKRAKVVFLWGAGIVPVNMLVVACM